MFGSGISYLTVDLIRIWKSSNKDDFAEKRDRYLAVENPPDASYYCQLDYGRMKKMIRFIDRNLDSVTPENEMKMEKTDLSKYQDLYAVPEGTVSGRLQCGTDQ